MVQQQKQKVTAPEVLRMKAAGERITMVTAYDFAFARLLDQAGVDVLLVGDSLGMVVQGNETTLPVTLDEMVYHTRLVTRGRKRALVVADLPFGRLGLTICYDLRFPYLYRALAQAGASFLSVPAAFTVPTGRAHWHVLLRARAIETGCFVLAPAQCGTHAEGRRTYGHSLVVSPWGEVLADGGEEPGLVLAEIDPAKVEEARRMVPALTHDRAFTGPAEPTLRKRLTAAGE